MMQESPIFTRTHDLLLWLLQTTRKFPRDQRFGLAAQLTELGFAFQKLITAAVMDTAQAAQHLLQADITLNLLRKSLLLCYETQLISARQYQHVSGLTKEVGALLGSMRGGKQPPRP